MKSARIERFTRTLKTRMHKFSPGRYRYTDVGAFLQRVSVHSTAGAVSTAVTPPDIDTMWQRLCSIHAKIEESNLSSSLEISFVSQIRK
jgi:hypothetical protein